jgi:hypothetical protein
MLACGDCLEFLSAIWSISTSVQLAKLPTSSRTPSNSMSLVWDGRSSIHKRGELNKLHGFWRQGTWPQNQVCQRVQGSTLWQKNGGEVFQTLVTSYSPTIAENGRLGVAVEWWVINSHFSSIVCQNQSERCWDWQNDPMTVSSLNRSIYVTSRTLHCKGGGMVHAAFHVSCSLSLL